MRPITYFGRRPWAETAEMRAVKDEAGRALAAITGLFAECRTATSARCSTVNALGELEQRQHVIIGNGAVKSEGHKFAPFCDDWLAKTVAVIREMWPDHGNMRLVLRAAPELRRWDAFHDLAFEEEAGKAWYVRLHAEPLSDRLATDEDFEDKGFVA